MTDGDENQSEPHRRIVDVTEFIRKIAKSIPDDKTGEIVMNQATFDGLFQDQVVITDERVAIVIDDTLAGNAIQIRTN